MSKIFENIINSSFRLDLNGVDTFEITPTVPNSTFNNFVIFIAHDQDIHIMPSINIEAGSLRNEHGEINDVFMDMFFSYEQYPVFTGFLHILAHAIESDNASRQTSVLEPDGAPVTALIRQIIANREYPCVEQGKSYSRLQDDNGGETSSTLDVAFVSDGVYVKVRSLDSLRFRTYYGGGKSHRVRNVLLILCYLIKNQQL